MIESDKKTIISNLFWKFLERGGYQSIVFVVQIVLARLLTPSDFGNIAIISVFINLANVFVQSGFNTALIQKRDTDEVDYSSVFFLSLLISVLLVGVIWLLSPAIADFYQQAILKKLLRTISFILILGAINSIQIAILSREMKFKLLFFSSFGAAVISGIIGITTACMGGGVWALVFQQMSNSFASCVIMWFTVKWRPKLLFSFQRIKCLFSYGWKLLCSGLIDTLYRNLYNLIIGRMYNATTLGYYNKADQFPQVVVSNINGSIQSVMLPALSKYQDDRKQIKSMVRRAIVTSSFFIFPIMVGMAACADNLVEILLTKKWLDCVPFMQILCFSYALWPIHTANLQALNAMGRSDIYLKLEVIKKVIGIISIIVCIPLGVMALVWALLCVGVISTVLNAWPNKKLLNYSTTEQIKDIMPSFIVSLIMGVVVYCISFLPINPVINLATQILVGACVYLIIAKCLKLECFEYLVNIVKKILS